MTLKYRKRRINFAEIEILEVKMGVQISKNTKHFHIALRMPPMQMDINDPLNIGKEELTSQKEGSWK